MARMQPSTAATDAYFIEGEILDSNDPEDARQWVTIYRELVSFAERTLRRMEAEAAKRIESEAGSASAELRWMEGHLAQLQSRLEHWERRLWELAGMDLDVNRRILNHGGQSLRLTRRETELLNFLAQRPGQFYSASQLVNQAWGTNELSDEQLRTYIVRLRRHLASGNVPARLVSEPRRGYGLVFTP